TKLGRAAAVGEEPIVTDSDKPARQRVEQESTNELLSSQGHRLLCIAGLVVLEAERDGSVLELQEAVIRDRHAVRVPTEVLQNLRGPAKRGFRVDHPLGLAAAFHQILERVRVG